MVKKIFLLLFVFLFSLFAQNKKEKIDQLVKIYNENGSFSGAILVSEHGKVIYSKGIGLANMEWDIPNSPDTKFRLGSVTKQFTSAAILQLVEQGKLKLDNKISDILTDYPKATGEKITIHNLLTHSSGIRDYLSIPEYFRDYIRKDTKLQELIDLFKDKDLDFEPGTKWAYSNSGYILLGAIIEKITGKPYEEVLKENIFLPLDMNNTGYDHFREIIKKRAAGYDKTPEGYLNCNFVDMSTPYAAGALYSTVEDLFKWDQALYTNKILPEESRKKIFTGYFDASPGVKYGYGWIIKYFSTGNNNSTLITEHGGGIYGFNTKIWREIENNNCIILLNNTPSANLNEMSETITKILHNISYDMPKKSATDKLFADYQKFGIDRAAENYLKLKKSDNKDYYFSEDELNRLGLGFLSSKKLREAVEVFKLNINLNPSSANAFDSYAEGLLATGDTAASITNYKKSLELDKKNYNAANILKKLNAGMSDIETIDTELLKSYIGKYQLNPSLIVDVTVENDKLYAQATGQPRYEIYPESPTRYFSKQLAAKVDFVKEGNKVTHIIVSVNGRELKGMKIN
jgi:CubicO group peptidase (beta-lactamase class C family)